MTVLITARPTAGTRLFWIFWGIDVLVALVFVVFFFIGLTDGSVSSFNIGLWFLIFLVLGSTLLGSYGLHRAGFNGWALAVASVVALPGLMYGFFILLIIIAQPRWN